MYHLFFWYTKLAQKLLGIFEWQPPQVSVCPRHRLLGRLGLFVILRKTHTIKDSNFYTRSKRVVGIYWRWSDLLLSGFVGHFDIGEALSTARGISHARNLQQTFPFHGWNKSSCCVPWSGAHLECWPNHQHDANFTIYKCIYYKEINTSSSIFIWKSSSFSSSGAKKDFSPYPAS